ncbi:MAG: right-handed parallel beta-helix repeat-containing protein [Acidimicrobiales bacterium]
MKRVRRVVVVVLSSSLLFLAMIVGNAAPASSEPCGLVVTGNYTLTGDITGCNGVTPITVAGSNLTLDLAGRTVSCVAGVQGEGPAIHVPFRTNVTIRNGTIRFCDTGVYLEGLGGHTLTNLNILDNVGALSGAGIFGEGIQLYGSHDNKILNNRVLRNGTFSGMNLYDSSRNTVTGNLVQDNNIIQVNSVHGGPTIMQDIGIWLIWLGDFPNPGVTQNLVANNQVINSGLDGIQLSTNTTGNTVQANTIVNNGCGQVPGIRNGDGIAVFGQSSLMQANTVQNNCGNGIYVRNNRLNHRIFSNQTTNNNTKPGTSPQFDLKDDNANCDNNQWVGNVQGTRNKDCIH